MNFQYLFRIHQVFCEKSLPYHNISVMKSDIKRSLKYEIHIYFLLKHALSQQFDSPKFDRKIRLKRELALLSPSSYLFQLHPYSSDSSFLGWQHNLTTFTHMVHYSLFQITDLLLQCVRHSIQFDIFLFQCFDFVFQTTFPFEFTFSTLGRGDPVSQLLSLPFDELLYVHVHWRKMGVLNEHLQRMLVETNGIYMS